MAATQKSLRTVDGYVEVPTAPGLGVEVDEQTVERYRIA